MSRAFDVIGAHYAEAFASRPGQVAAGEWLLEQLKGDRVVLDVGCGSGVPTARQLTEAGCTVVGVDNSPVMLDLARKNVPGAIFVEREMHDLQGLHPQQGRFDGAAAFFSLLVLDRADVRRALDAIRGVLAADAAFVLGMVEGDSDHVMRDFLGVPVPLTAFPRAELIDLMAHHGFTVVDLTAEESIKSTTETPEQTLLYLRCTLTPTM